MSNPFDQFDSVGDSASSNPFDQFDAAAPAKKSKGILGDLTGALAEGAKSAGRAVAGTVNVYTGDEQGLVDKANAQAKAEKPTAINDFNRAVESRVKPLGEDPGLWDSIKAIGGAVVEQPKGAGLAVVEQIPNAAPAMAGGFAGMKGGAALGTAVAPGVGTAVGAVVGGLAGMFLGNAAIETGYKGIEAAQDGSVSPEEMYRVRREGATKAAVITGVDALTLGLSKAATSIPARAVESATRNALTKAGIDVADEAAVLAARQSPEISAAVRAAQESAFASASTLGKRAAAGGAALGLETVGEGLGEYLGELAATGKANVADAVLESLMSLGQSGAEVAWGAMRNRKSERGGVWDAAQQGEAPPTQPAPPTLITEPEPLQKRIDDLMRINTDAMADNEREQYEKDLTAAFLEPVGITQDANGLEVPFTMADYLSSQVRAEDSARARPMKQGATQQADTRLQQLADEEAATQPDITPAAAGIASAPSIPVVGPLSAVANMAVQSGAHAATVAQQQAAQASNGQAAQKETSSTGSGNVKAEAQQPGVLAGIASQAPSIAQAAPSVSAQSPTTQAAATAAPDTEVQSAAQPAQVAQEAPQANAPQAGAQPVAAPAAGEGPAIDLSNRTETQLNWLAQRGKTGFKEAAVAELQRRGVQVSTPQVANGVAIATAGNPNSDSLSQITNGDGVVSVSTSQATARPEAFDEKEREAKREALKERLLKNLQDNPANFDANRAKLVAFDEQTKVLREGEQFGWNRMSAAKREALVVKAGWAGKNRGMNLIGSRIASQAWEVIKEADRAKLISASQNQIKNETPVVDSADVSKNHEKLNTSPERVEETAKTEQEASDQPPIKKQDQPSQQQQSRAPSPIERRDDLVGAIMRVTGGNGIHSKMAQTISGDKANAAGKLRGLFTLRGIIDLDDTAELLRTEEGYDVRDGSHLAELIREQAAGNQIYSMERTEREAAENAEKQYREDIRRRAADLGIKTVAVKFDAIERAVIEAEAKQAQDEIDAEREAIQAEGAVAELNDEQINVLLAYAAQEDSEKGRYIDGQWISNEEILEGFDASAALGEYQDEAGADGAGETTTGEAGGNRAQRSEEARPDFGLTRQTNEQAAEQFAQQQAGDNDSPTKEQSDRERDAVPFGKPAVDAENKPKSESPSDADAVDESLVDQHAASMDKLRDGTLSLDAYRAGFAAVVDGKDAIKAELSALTKDGIFKRFTGLAYRYRNDKKADVVDAAYRAMLDDFVLANSISWSMGQKYEDVIRGYVDKASEASLSEYAEKVKSAKEERQQAHEETAKAIADPHTLGDFRDLMRLKTAQGQTLDEARLGLTPEQRVRFDNLLAEESRSQRTSAAATGKAEVRVAAKTTSGDIIETKHTKTDQDLFVVKAAERVEREVYNQWNAAAKKLGGWYSSFRGNGAVPGFQFKTRDDANAFLQYLGGDATAAQEAVQEKRDAFADDRSQSAAERLNEMADRLDERADESLGRERKANTSRRARFAASAEAAASSDKALAKTMRNIADAIAAGTAKFLDRVRQKTQVEMLRSAVNLAKYEELRKKYDSYLEQERHRGEKPTGETADYARWPTFTADRADLARLARDLLQIDGAKLLGQRMLKVADDVTEAYQKFAKENLHKVSVFSAKREGSEISKPAIFSTADKAEAAIARSGYKGKATTISFKRGEHLVIMGPEMARESGLWQGDPDKRITLSAEFGEEVVAKVKALGKGKVAMPYVFENVSAERARWQGLGIETAAEQRAALREFIALQEAPAVPDRIKQMERAMIGRKSDGLDFFPTPADTAKAMIEAAELEEGMSVLEPSAGMGHIAEQIRDVAGIDHDVIEFAADRRELLEAKGFNVVGQDFIAATGQYDRIIMNPPFSNRRDAEHVQHAYSLLKPGGRLVAIMGEGVFYGQDKKAVAFREWLESVGGASEKLPDGSFMDPSLPVNTGVNARLVVIDRPLGESPSTQSRMQGGHAISGIALYNIADDDTPIAEEQKRWSSVVDDFFAGKINKSESPVIMRSTPASLQALGLPDYEIRTSLSHGVEDAMYNHGIKPSQLKAIPLAMANPQAIFVNKGADGKYSLNVLTDMFVNGKQIAIALQPSKYGVSSGPVHFVATVTPRENGVFAKMAENGMLVYSGQNMSDDVKGGLKKATMKYGQSAIDLKALIASKFVSTARTSKVVYKSDLVNLIKSGQAQYSAETNGNLTPSDTAIYGMAAEGKSAADILGFIASNSRNPFYRQLAKLLMKTGVAPSVTVGDGKGWKFNAGEGNRYAAGYNPETNTVALFRPASSERNVLHELIHAASLKALSGKGMASAQMKTLYQHVKKSGKLKGMYGMSDVDEFIAEAFSNPKFQERLKSVSSTPVGGKASSAWNWFVRIVRGILGIPQGQENALSQALEIGVDVMQEDMKLRNSEAGVPFSEITGREIDKVLGRSLQEKATNWMRGKLQGKSFKNDATGWEISVGRKGINKAMMHAAKEVHARSVAAIPSLLKHAVLVASEENRNAEERKSVPLVHHFYAPLRIGGADYVARLVVKEARDGTRFYDYETSDEISPAVPGELLPFTQRMGNSPSARPDMSMAKLLSHVKEEHGGTDPRFVRYNVADEGWSVAEPSKMDDVIYALQDKQIDMKRVIQSIMKTGKNIRDEFNAYLQEELFHGRAAKGVKDFLDFELRPLLADMQKAGVDMSDFEEYLWHRHAEERNKQIAKINPDMPDGGSGIDTADARAYLSGLSADRRRAFEGLAAKVEAMNRESQRVLVESGLETQATIDAWNGAYQHYVPLQREDVDSGHVGTGKGFSVRGSASKRAMGSGRRVVDIIANLTMQRERNIVRAEKNRVSNALLGLAVQNPNPEFWKVDQAPKERVVEERAIYTVLDADGNKIDEFTRMDDAERLANKTPGASIDQTWGDRVTERVMPGFKNRDNVLLTRINGQDHYIIFNERDERAMRMAAAMKNLDVDNLGRVLSIVGKATRYLASINTQYNPVFGVINLIRDTQGALINLSSTPLAGEQKRVLGYTKDALVGIYKDIRAHRAGKKPSSNWAALFEEFQKEGGQTGYRDQYAGAEQRAEAIKSELAQFKEGKAKQLVRGLFGWLSDYNETMENAVRLAAYKAATEKGMSKQQAASLAKNITVNFNRKGQMATQVGALYAFFNASVQGSARIAETLFEQHGGDIKNVRLSKKGKQILMGGIMLGSMQALLLAAAGFDDDEPPEFVRERNLILPIGDGKYLTLAMPLGLHVIPGIGRIATEFLLSGGKDPLKRMASFASMFSDAFNPVGSAGWSLQTITPSVVDPFAALAENKDFTGKEIYREDFNKLNPQPGHARAKDVATVWSRYISEALNFVTGGSEYRPGLISWSPDAIDYLIAQATGGVGREVNKAAQTIGSAYTGEDLPLYKVPLVGRFVGDTEGQSGQSQKFYNALRQINMHESEYKGLLKDGRRQEAMEYMAENPAVRLILAGNHAENAVRKLRSMKRDLVEKDAEKDQIRAIDERITATMRSFNERARAVM